MKKRIQFGDRAFKGLPAYEEQAPTWRNKIQSEAVEKTVRAGRIYHKIAAGTFTAKQRERYLGQFVQKFPETVYTESAKAILTAKEDKPKPFDFFLNKSDALRLYRYPMPPASK